MSCPLSRCKAPGCTGAAWRPQSTDPADVQAYLADVAAHMRRTRLPFGKAAAAVFHNAMTGKDCVFR